MTSVQRIQVGKERFVLIPERQYERMVGAAIPKGSKEATSFARMSIGRDLRKKREAAGLTQVALARRAGIRVETLSRLENGKGNPTVGTVRKILQAVGA